MDTDRFPSPDQGACLHARLLANDPVAPRDLCCRYLPPLTRYLSGRFRHLSPDLCEAAACEAVHSLLLRPHRYDPAGLDLARFLRMAARRDLYNLRKREQRQTRLIDPSFPVELAADARNHRRGGPLTELLAREQAEADRHHLCRLRAAFTPAEQGVLDLMLAGERGTAAFAYALGIDHLPPAEQEQAVKRLKDRIKKRLARGGPDDRPDRRDGAAGAA